MTTDVRAPLTRRRSLLLALLGAVLIMWLSGAISRWGLWYAPEPYYRAQVHSLLHGHLALTDKVEGVTHDLVWVDGGVQQVWGLGVPMWLSAWELIGKPFGLSPFPDRIAMMFGVVLVLWALHRAWLGRTGDRSAASRGAFLFTALLPGVLTMLRGRIAVYEEAQAYSYGSAMLLLCGVILMIRRPSTRTYLCLLAFAGATGLMRPTVWFYGFASAVVATALYMRAFAPVRRWLPKVALGGGLFLLGGAALYATNYLRFGRGSEFGHHLNVQDLPGNLYATRFDYPFETTPLVDTAKELVGGLFDRPELKSPPGYKFYEKKLHRGQSTDARWREYYFTTYTWGYLPLIVGGIGLTLFAWLRVRRKEPTEAPARKPIAIEGAALLRESRWLGAWALMGSLPLLIFYLRSPAVSSRYYLDVAPGLGLLLVITWRHLAAWLRPRGFANVALAALLVWWVFSFLSFTAKRPWSSPIRYRAAVEGMMPRSDPMLTGRPLPEAYELTDPQIMRYVGGDQLRCPCYLDMYGEDRCDHTPFMGVRADVDDIHNDEDHLLTTRIHNEPETACVLDGPWPAACDVDDPDPAQPAVAPPRPEYEIRTDFVPVALYRNGTNWDLQSGVVGVATYFFVDDPEYLEVEVAPADKTPLAAFVPQVRAKIQLEELPLVSTANTARGVVLRFAGPRTERYKHGLQVAFLGFGPPEKLDQPTSDYRLLRVAWHDGLRR